jgi:hypothetical protein
VPTSVTGEVISVSVATPVLGLARWRVKKNDVSQHPFGQRSGYAADVAKLAGGDVED